MRPFAMADRTCPPGDRSRSAIAAGRHTGTVEGMQRVGADTSRHTVTALEHVAKTALLESTLEKDSTSLILRAALGVRPL